MAKQKYQSVGKGMAIRDDGVLVPATPRILAQPNIRLYTGDPRATLEERMRWLQGYGNQRRVVIGLEPEIFDVRVATKDELLEFALTDYGKTLDGTKSVDELRAEVIAMVRQQREDEARTEIEASQNKAAADVPAAPTVAAIEQESPAPLKGAARRRGGVPSFADQAA